MTFYLRSGNGIQDIPLGGPMSLAGLRKMMGATDGQSVWITCVGEWGPTLVELSSDKDLLQIGEGDVLELRAASTGKPATVEVSKGPLVLEPEEKGFVEQLRSLARQVRENNEQLAAQQLEIANLKRQVVLLSERTRDKLEDFPNVYRRLENMPTTYGHGGLENPSVFRRDTKSSADVRDRSPPKRTSFPV